MPQGVIVQDLRVLSLSCRFQHRQRRAVRAIPTRNIACCEGRLFRLHVLIAAGHAGRGEDLEPTASGWGHLHLQIYARRRTNHSVGLRELVAQRLGVASLSGGWRLTLERPVDMQRSAAAPLGPVSPSARQQDRRPATLQQAEPRALSACGYSPARGFGCNVRPAENVPAAARPSRGEHPTARWSRATQRRAGCL
jgi:hypothetical protein